MLSLQLNTSYRLHLIIGLVVSVWLVMLLVLIAPFDVSDLPFAIRLQILPPYGIISFLGYLLVIPLQNKLFSIRQNWTVLHEGSIILLFNIFVLLGSYAYYKTGIINGTYPFMKFTFQVYYPIFFMLLPIIIFGRWFLTKKSVTPSKDELVLTGENKYDFLKLKTSDLVCVSSADNYVEVVHLDNKTLKRKLLRNTLKNIAVAQPELLRVHRSHLINPNHFKEWKDPSTIILTKIEIPISKNYKEAILAIDNSPLK